MTLIQVNYLSICLDSCSSINQRIQEQHDDQGKGVNDPDIGKLPLYFPGQWTAILILTRESMNSMMTRERA